MRQRVEWVAFGLFEAATALAVAGLHLDRALGFAGVGWALLAVACFVGAVYAARRLRWWLIAFVPVAWIAVRLLVWPAAALIGFTAGFLRG